MDKLNCIWEWIDRFGENGKRDLVWADEYGEHLHELRPYLLRAEELAARVPCERYRAGGGCQYRVMKMTRGNLVGVCDEQECPTVDFTETELLQSKVNLPKLLREIAQLMQLQPVVEPMDRQRNQWTLATAPGSGGDAVTVYFVRGFIDTIFETAVLNLLADNSAPFILITATTIRHSPRLLKQLKGGGCAVFTVANNFQVTGRQISWLPGGRERWEQLLAAIKLTQVGEAPAVTAYKYAATVAERVERKVESVGRDMTALKAENAALKAQLTERFTAVAKKVDAQYFQWFCAILATGSKTKAAQSLGIAKTTFTERYSRFVEMGGIYRQLDAIVEARQKHLGNVSVASLDALMSNSKYEPEAAKSTNWLEELLDALQAMKGDNWQELREEMLEILAEA